MNFPIRSRYELDSTQSAPIFLSLEQHQPLFRVGFPSYLSLLALYPIFLERWVVGRISPSDFGEAGDRGFVGLDQFCLRFIMECPIAIFPEVPCFYPLTSFLRMTAFCPYPQHLPLGMSDLLEGSLGCTVSVVICPPSYDWVERLDYLDCSGLLMCVQIGTYRPVMFQDLFLLWDGQQCTLFPEFPDVKPQEVEPFCDMHDAGFGFTERQSSLFEERLDSWSGVGLQYFPSWGRYHKI